DGFPAGSRGQAWGGCPLTAVGVRVPLARQGGLSSRLVGFVLVRSVLVVLSAGRSQRQSGRTTARWLTGAAACGGRGGGCGRRPRTAATGAGSVASSAPVGRGGR